MLYRVLKGSKKFLMSDGSVYVIEAEPLDRIDNPKIFLFPDDEYLINDIGEEFLSNEDHIWEPDEEDFFEGNMYDINGQSKRVFRFFGLQSPSGDFDWGNYLIKIRESDILDYQQLSYSNCSLSFLQLVYNCFVFNQMSENIKEDEYTLYYVYSDINNNITMKQYRNVVEREHVLDGIIDVKSFAEWITLEFGQNCADNFLQSVLDIMSWYTDINSLINNYYTWIHWYDLTDIANVIFASDPDKLESTKMGIAFLWLKRFNT